MAALETDVSVLLHLLPLNGRRDSLVGQIVDWLGRAIIEGRLRPGDDLNSVELARRFNTSRTPVREALMLLEKEGLVEVPPRRRPRVAPVGPQQVREIYQVRATLYALVARLVATSASDEEIGSLRGIFDEMARAADAGDLGRYFWTNVAFHVRAAEVCGNPTLKRILDSLGLRTLQLRHLGLSQPNRMQESRADHERLMRAYEERDPDLAAALTRSNVLAGLAAIERSGWASRQPAGPNRRRRRVDT